METKKYINFLEFRDTSLDAGEYTIKLDQSLKIGGTDRVRKTVYQQLYVKGDRFVLKPSAIHQVYPPSGSAADYQTVLPHLIMNRSQFPWERSIDGIPRNSAPNYPWLALLVFHDDPGVGEEPPRVETIKVEEYFQSAVDGEVFVPGVDTHQSLREFLEYGESKSDPVSVIDVPRTLLESIIPLRSDLRLSAHVRRDMTFTGTDEADIAQQVSNFGADTEVDMGQEYGVIVANRLPKPGCRNVVHLVSIRNAYVPESDGEFDFPDDDRAIRLVSLKNWSFFSNEQNRVFADILGDVDCTPFRLAQSTGNWVDDYVKNGFTLLPHLLRTGDRTVSFYRGPLSPGRPSDPFQEFSLPVPSADHMLLYDERSGVMDTSYAAAWTLGRQLALADQNFALELYNYKKQAAMELAKSNQSDSVSHLPLTLAEEEATADGETPEEKILAWLSTYTLLGKIPFPYLIPATPQRGGSAEGVTNFLPEESVRFFQLDGFWLQCVRYGALSLGDIPDVTVSDENKAILEPITPAREGMISGFLLRSKVVQFFPDLMVEGFAEDLANPNDPDDPEFHDGTSYIEGGVTPTLRQNLSDEIMLCLFEELEVATVDIFLAPRSLHFGLVRDDFETEGEVKLYKILKDLDGSLLQDDNEDPIAANAEQWRSESQRVLDLEQLAVSIKTTLAANTDHISTEGQAEFLKSGPPGNEESFTSADYAMVMLNGAPRVRFSVKTNSAT